MSVLSRLLYVVTALMFVPFVGFNADEVMFLSPLFPPHWAVYSWGPVPLMLMPYLGATKTLAYALLMRWLPASPLVVRLPVVLLSCATLYLFLRVVTRVADRRIAIVATALLATDTTFVLCTSLDWAPAAVQICGSVLLAGLAIRAVERPTAVWLAAIGFLAGFLVWNKAVFLFSLAGALIAAGIVFRDRIGKMNRRAVLILICAFTAGALPLILYNVHSGLGTWHAREALEDYGTGFKIMAAVKTLDGSIFNGYLFAKPAGIPGRNLLAIALLASALALPWVDWKRRRLLLFAWVAMLATFLLMLPFRNAGAGPQHIVLLYPLPHLILAATFAPSADVAGWFRKLGVGVLAAVVCAGVLLTVTYRLQMSANGLTVYWTDAIFGLDRQMRERHVTEAVAADWGIEEPLRVLSKGRVNIAPEERATPELLRTKGLWIVAHSAQFTLYPRRLEGLRETAHAAGVALVPVSQVSDGHGRVVFEIYSAR
jgi:hypothetical protein